MQLLGVQGVKGLASLGPFLGAPADSGAGQRYQSPRAAVGHGCEAGGSCRLWRLWKSSTHFLREAGLEKFNEPLGTGSHSSWCPLFSLWSLLEEFHTPALCCGNLDIISTTPRIRLGTLRAQCLADNGYMFCGGMGASGRLAHIFCVKGNLDPEVDSVLLSGVRARGIEKYAISTSFSYLTDTCSARSPGVLTPR